MFHFLRTSIEQRIVSLLQVEMDEIPVSRVTSSRPSPQSPWIVRTQSRYEFVTCRHFILSCRQVFSQEAAAWLQAAPRQVFFSPAFFWKTPKTKRLVSMLSGNYTVQDTGPSYLALKDTSVVCHHMSSPSCPISHAEAWEQGGQKAGPVFYGLITSR